MSRFRTLVVMVVAAAVCAGWSPAGALLARQPGQDPQQPQFRAGVRTVPVYASVRDKDGEFMLDLTKDDFEVYDNGKLQELTLFTRDVQPITAIVLIDGSSSMMPMFRAVLDAASQFIIRLMPGDKGRVASFADKTRMSPKFTSDRDELLDYIHDEFNIRVANTTRLWDGVADSLFAFSGTEGRRVVLILSDGYDTSSSSTASTVMGTARRDDVLLYAVAVWTHEGTVRVKPNRDLEVVAQDSGGGYYEMRENDDMNSVTTRIAMELHNQYVLGFTPAALDGKVHKLEVRVKRPDMLVRSRKSYVAEDKKK